MPNVSVFHLPINRLALSHTCSRNEGKEKGINKRKEKNDQYKPLRRFGVFPTGDMVPTDTLEEGRENEEKET